jgi:hypothetical protein
MAASKAARATPALIRRDPPKSFATGERHQPSKAETKSTQADELAAFLSLHWRKASNGWRLYEAKDRRFGKVFPDARIPGMWRSALPGGDWRGSQIEANTRRVLERLVGELDWKRIALTEQQVKRYRLKRFEIDKPDRRHKPVRYHPAIEAEALKQQEIVRIIRNALDAELPEPLSAVLEREQRQRVKMRRLLTRRTS